MCLRSALGRMLLLLAAVVLVAAWASAQDVAEYSLQKPRELPEQTGANLRYGATSLHPYLKLSLEHDDNIFLAVGNEQDDLITDVTAGLMLDMNKEKGRLQAGYEANALWYADHSSEDRVEHRGFGILDWRINSAWRLKLSDELTRMGGVQDDAQFQIEKRLRNAAGAGLGYDHNRLSFDLAYLYVVDRYDDLDEFDRDDQVAVLTGSYAVFPKTRVLLEVGRGWIDYDEPTISDADYYQVRLGLSGQITSKISGVAKAGYQSRDYDQERPSDFSGFVAYVSLTMELSERTDLVFTGRRDLPASTFFDNAYYKRTLLSAELNQKLGNKWTGALSAAYQQNDYPESNQVQVGSIPFGPFSFPVYEDKRREDEIVTAKAELKYHVRDWAWVALSYTYETRDSNVTGFDYDDNRVALTVSMTF